MIMKISVFLFNVYRLSLERWGKVVERSDRIPTDVRHWVFQHLEEGGSGQDGAGLESWVKDENDGGCSPVNTG